MVFELQFLDWLQTLQTTILNEIMKAVTHLGDAGALWIILAAVLLAFPKTRKSGAIVAAALSVALVLCNGILKNIFARTRPFDVKEGISLLITAPKDFSFPSGHTAASFTAVAALYFAGVFCRREETLENKLCCGCFDCVFQNVSVRSLSDGYFGRDHRRNRIRTCRGVYNKTGTEKRRSSELDKKT